MDHQGEQICDPHSPPDIEPAGEKGHDVCTERNDVCAQITEGVGKDKEGADEEHGGARPGAPGVVQDVVIKQPRIPVKVAPEPVDSCSAENAECRAAGVGDGESDELRPEGSVLGLGVSCNVGLVDDQCRCLARD